MQRHSLTLRPCYEFCIQQYGMGSVWASLPLKATLQEAHRGGADVDSDVC